MTTGHTIQVEGLQYLPHPHDFIIGKLHIALPSKEINGRDVTDHIRLEVRIKARPDATLSEVQEALVEAGRAALRQAVDLTGKPDPQR